MNSLFSLVIMAAVTLGMMNVPHAMFYTHPQLIFDLYRRRDLDIS